MLSTRNKNKSCAILGLLVITALLIVFLIFSIKVSESNENSNLILAFIAFTCLLLVCNCYFIVSYLHETNTINDVLLQRLLNFFSNPTEENADLLLEDFTNKDERDQLLKTISIRMKSNNCPNCKYCRLNLEGRVGDSKEFTSLI